MKEKKNIIAGVGIIVLLAGCVLLLRLFTKQPEEVITDDTTGEYTTTEPTPETQMTTEYETEETTKTPIDISMEETSQETENETGEALEAIGVFDNGRLKLAGSLEYDGPDFEAGTMEMGTYTMLKIQNISDSFLRRAEVELKVNGTEKMQVIIEAIPAGATVLAIGHGYEAFAEGDTFTVTSCTSVYERQVQTGKEGLNISSEPGEIHITNQTTKEMTGIICRYKGKLDDMLFGGRVYETRIDRLPAGETVIMENESFLVDEILVVEITEEENGY